ncbi:MAG: aspartate kinase, partial [Thermoanaerobaculia bacterium]
MTESKPEVLKFGGVGMGSGKALRSAAANIRKAGRPAAVVVSAMNGVTDLLHEVAQAALRAQKGVYGPAAAAFAAKHTDLITEVIRTKRDAEELRAVVAESTRELLSMADSISVLRELTPRAHDALVARGERVLATIFTRFLNQEGIDSSYVDATDVIITERRLGSTWPNFTKSERAARKIIEPFFAAGRVVVMPGYLGRGSDGEVVTLGRGGTDFSAAILARCLGARSVTLFKEVDGLMTADTKSVPSARVLAELHYREAAELAFYGAKVLHPRTMIPLVDRKIPLFIRNAFHDDHAGTRVADDVKPGEYPVKALTAIHKQALIAIEG